MVFKNPKWNLNWKTQGIFNTLIKQLISWTRALQVLVFKNPKWNLNWKTQGVFWENFELRKSWLDYSIFESFFCSERLQKYGSVRFGLDPAPVFRRCQLLSLKPQWFTQRLINPNKQILLFMKLRNCSRNLDTINFSKFFKLYFSELNYSKVCFILGRENLVWCHHSWWNHVFLKIRFLIKSESHMLVSCLYCVWHHLWLLSHLLPYYYLKFTFTRLPTDCLVYPVENDDISKRVNIFSKFMLQMLQNLCLILLWTKFASNWTNIKQIRKDVPVAPSSSTYLTSKKTNFSRVPELTSFKLSWITISTTSLKMFQYNHNYQKFLSLNRFFLQASFLFLIDTVFQIIQKHL